MTSVTARITSKGHITFPREIWEQLGLESGDTVRFEIKGGEIKVYPERNFDFSMLIVIGVAPLSEECDVMTAPEVIEDLRGKPDKRATMQVIAIHPDVTFLNKP